MLSKAPVVMHIGIAFSFWLHKKAHKKGVLQLSAAPLQLLCGAQIAAQGISSAAGQTVTSAISSSFGPSPCKLFEGDNVLLMKPFLLT